MESTQTQQTGILLACVHWLEQVLPMLQLPKHSDFTILHEQTPWTGAHLSEPGSRRMEKAAGREGRECQGSEKYGAGLRI